MSHSAIWETYGKLAVEGDPAALDSLLQTYRPRLKALAGRTLARRYTSKADASDVVQEVCRDAYVHIGTVRATNGPQFWSWLRTLLTRRVCDVHRLFGDSRKRAVALEVPVRAFTFLRSADQSTVSERLIRLESHQQLCDAIEALPLAYRTVIRLRFFQGLTFDEIGSLVDRSPDSVRMLVNRAIKALRVHLEDLRCGCVN